VIGIWPPIISLSVIPKRDDDILTSGRMFFGISNLFKISSSHFKLFILNIIVLLAFEKSVENDLPLVNLYNKNVSTVPNPTSPFSIFFLKSKLFLKSHINLVNEKYGSTTSPVLL